MKTYLLLFIITKSILSNVNTNNPYTNSEQLISKTLTQLDELILKITNQPTLKFLSKCHTKLSELNRQVDNKVIEMINYSSKNSFEMGNYAQCINNDEFAYHLLTYDELLSNDNSIQRAYSFLNQSTYYFGICIHKECNGLIEEFSLYKTEFESYFHLSNYTFISISKEYRSKNTTIMLVIFIILMIIFAIKLLFTFFYNCFINNSLKSSKTDESIDDEDEEEEENEDHSEYNKPSSKRLTMNSQNNDNLVSVKTRTTIDRLQEQEHLKKQTVKKHWISFFNLLSNLKDIYSIKNSYYNEKKIQFIALIRAIALFFYVYHQHFLIVLQLSSRDIYKTNYYMFSETLLLKLSSYALNVWILLEGFECSFKLMTYIKTNLENLSFLTYVKFYLLFLPKAITFYLMFYFFHFSLEGLTSFSFFNPPFMSFILRKNNTCGCMSDAWRIFAFWEWFIDKNPNDSNNDYPCFILGNLFYNTHFCFIFLLLFMYLAFKIRKKLFDILLFFLYFSLLISSYFTCNERYRTVNLFYVIGEHCFIKLPHVFLIDYLSGVFGGVMYFYFIDIINSNSIQDEMDYIPLWLCNTLMRHFYKISLGVKRLLMIILLLLLLFITLVGGFAYQSSQSEFNLFFQIFALYEKKLFNLVLVLIILFFQTKEISIVKYLYEIQICTLISRISFTYLCFISPLIYMYYIGFNMELNMNKSDLFFMTCGLSFMLFLINLIIYITIEQPIRLLIKIIKVLIIIKETDKQE